MTKTDFTRKEGLGGSLALRIIFVALIFLVVPLFFFSIISYVQDYRLRVHDHFSILNLLGEEKIALTEDEFQFRVHELTLIDHLIKPTKKSPEDLSQLFSEFAWHRKYGEIFYLTLESDGEAICHASSDPQFIGKNFSFLIDGGKSLQKDFSVVFGKENARIYYVKNIIDPKSKKIEGAIIIDNPASALIDKIELLNLFDYPLIYSLLTKDGQVIFSSEKSMFRKRFLKEKNKEAIHLTPFDTKGYLFDIDGDEQLAVERTFKDVDLKLLLSISDEINIVSLKHHIYRALILFTIFLVIGGGGAILFTMRISRPQKRLCQVMKKVGEGDFSAQYTPDRMGFEINVLGEICNHMVRSLVDYIEKVKEERAQKEAIKKELMLGHQVQQSLLPKELPHFSHLDIAAGFIPAKEVGGDFYDWLIRRKNGGKEIMLSIGDISGKGIFACLYSLGIRSMLRSFGERGNDLSDVIIETNKLFCYDTGDTGVFVTAWVAFFEPKEMALYYTNCGHFPGLLMHPTKEIKQLTTEGIALGVVPLDRVETKKIIVQKGDTLVLFTDGVVEAQNSRNELFTKERLLQTLKENQGHSADEISQNIRQAVATFSEGMAQYDDLTLVVINFI